MNSLITAAQLGMKPAIRLTGVSKDTFHYRHYDHRIIDFAVLDQEAWDKLLGPLIYAVTDRDGVVRYIGKWVSPSGLKSRWIRRGHIHHGPSSRAEYIAHLEARHGPIDVWVASITQLRENLPDNIKDLSDKEVAKALEAEWQHRWADQCTWGSRLEPLAEGFSDGEFWNG